MEHSMNSSQFLKLMIIVGIFLTDIWLCIYADFHLHYNVFFWLIALFLGQWSFYFHVSDIYHQYLSAVFLSSKILKSVWAPL